MDYVTEEQATEKKDRPARIMNLKIDEEVANVFKQESREVKCIDSQYIIDLNAELERLASIAPPPENKQQSKYKPGNIAALNIVLQKGSKFGALNKQGANQIIEEAQGEDQSDPVEAKPKTSDKEKKTGEPKKPKGKKGKVKEPKSPKGSSEEVAAETKG